MKNCQWITGSLVLCLGTALNAQPVAFTSGGTLSPTGNSYVLGQPFVGLMSAGTVTLNAGIVPCIGACPADIGGAGGFAGSDGVLDNNDFIVFVTWFFASDARADRGVAGGFAGSDGLFDNNDFIAYINQFFNGC